ncbi:hypothetical protein phiPsa267_009 [Pseudomonas phage phiPsa267]|uniref:Uncharacterized protein n=1 Tax=Pseudomonas phage phiPsa267 TaxID=1460361 RepID=A0A7G9V120_9CAUD|nr:hypothetical protein QGX19_gp009 [Pseudomonas phage phiPsa267]QNN99975.1 hypothetical protein phiPsa267_009 [Pseudomonas phage phiPsa267]
MTAVKAVAFETRSERQLRIRKEWIADAMTYLFAIGIFAQEEISDCYDLADNLHWHSKDEGGEMMYSAKEAVDEELTYWGD